MKKRGTLLCCIPLLAKWFTSHLPQSALKNEQRLTWSQRMMSLTHSDIRWCSRSLEDISIIDRCGEFPNVPLLGIRGGITYNPCLALRQFGYVRRDDPHEMLVQGLVFDYDKEDQGYRQRFARAWGMVNKVDSRTLGHKNSIPLEPYLRWVWARAQSLLMPYPSILPVIIEPVIEGDVPYTVLHPDMPTSLEDLQKAWVQLKEERDTFEAQFYASEKKVLELTKQLHEERSLNSYITPKKMRSTFLS